MKWNFQVSADHISEYILTSSEGQIVSFKYSRLQRSIRMKYNTIHNVYLLDKTHFAGRKFSLRNVYGSEIGTLSRTFLNEHAGIIHMHDSSSQLHYKIDPKNQSVHLQNEQEEFSCSLPGHFDKANEEFYMLAIVVLSWVMHVDAPAIAKALVRSW